MEGTFTCPERVERDGLLVCFEGQVMTMHEADALGLVEQNKEPTKKEPTKKEQLILSASVLGIDVPKKATIADIEALIADASGDGEPGEGDYDEGDQSEE